MSTWNHSTLAFGTCEKGRIGLGSFASLSAPNFNIPGSLLNTLLMTAGDRTQHLLRSENQIGSYCVAMDQARQTK